MGGTVRRWVVLFALLLPATARAECDRSATDALAELLYALSTVRRIPVTVSDPWESFRGRARPGRAESLLRELVYRVKDADGDPALSAGERGRLDRAFASVTRAKPWTEDDVRTAASRIGETLSGADTAPHSRIRGAAARRVEALPFQILELGVGMATVHRYSVVIEGADADRLFRTLSTRFTDLIDPARAHFYKTTGGPVRLGDRFLIQTHAHRPFDRLVPDDPQMAVVVTGVRTTGPTRSIVVTTLDGHPLAGENRFQVTSLDDGRVRVAVESVTTFNQPMTAIAFDRFGRAEQVALWTEFLNRAVKASGGRAAGAVRIE